MSTYSSVPRWQDTVAWLSLLLLLSGATIAYAASPLLSGVGYVSGLLGASGMLAFLPWSRRNGLFILGIGLALQCVTVTALVQSPRLDVEEALQGMLYPIVQSTLLLTGYCAIVRYQTSVAVALWVVAFLNGAVALANTLAGPLHLPVFGVLQHGRAIFGTDLPSSAGLMFNVNYYATFQGAVFLMLLGLRDNAAQVSRWGTVGLAAVLLSGVLGSSRGATAALVLALGAYVLLKSAKAVQYMRATVLIIGVVAVCVYLLTHYYPTIADTFRFAKGLNNRDTIWGAAVKMYSQRPWIGWGGHNYIADQLLTHGSPNASVQSTFLIYLLRVGAVGFILVGALLLAAVPPLRNSAFRARNAWAYALVLYWLINSAVRTYTLGGLGAIPVLATVGLSVLLTAPVVSCSARSTDGGNHNYSVA